VVGFWVVGGVGAVGEALGEVGDSVGDVGAEVIWARVATAAKRAKERTRTRFNIFLVPYLIIILLI
jgi:hypothetical protein